MSIIIDLIAIGIIAIFAILSAKKGFVRTLIEVVGFVLVILLASRISPVLSEATYDNLIEPSIVSSLENISFDADISDANVSVLPKTVSTFLGESFDLSGFKSIIEENISQGVEGAVTTASQQVLKPVFLNIFTLLYTLIISLVLLFVVNILAKLINKIFSFSIIGKANRVLGGLLGIIKGVIAAAVFCTAISLLISLTPSGFLFFTPDAVEGSVIFNLLSI